MRKTLIAVLALSMIAALGVSPATAGKKKTTKGSFEAEAVPFPVTGQVAEGGCLGGMEGVHKVSVPFTAKKAGVLTVNLLGFEGDWDLHVTTPDGVEIVSSTAGQPVDPPGETVTIPLAAKTEVLMVACNWAGGPTASAEYSFTY